MSHWLFGRVVCCGIPRHDAAKTMQHAARHRIRCEHSLRLRRRRRQDVLRRAAGVVRLNKLSLQCPCTSAAAARRVMRAGNTARITMSPRPTCATPRLLATAAVTTKDRRRQQPLITVTATGISAYSCLADRPTEWEFGI